MGNSPRQIDNSLMMKHALTLQQLDDCLIEIDSILKSLESTDKDTSTEKDLLDFTPLNVDLLDFTESETITSDRPLSVGFTEKEPVENSVDLSFLDDDLLEFPPVKDDATEMGVPIFFDEPALEIIRRMATHFFRVPSIRDRLYNYEAVPIPGLLFNFEQRLAMCLCLNFNRRVRNWSVDNNAYLISSVDVITELNHFMYEFIYQDWNYYNPDQVIEHMLDSYPVSILAQVCQTTLHNAHHIGEVMKYFIRQHKRPFPDKLQNIVENHVALTGEPQSPLTISELEALYRYLNVKRSAYIHILLSCLFEFARCDRIITTRPLTEDEMIAICEAPWFYLLQFYP